MINKIVFNSAVMVTALEQVKRAMVRNPIIPILENYLIEVVDGLVKVSGTDLQTTVRVTIPVETQKGAENFSVILEGGALQFLKKIDEQPITLVHDSEKYVVELIDDEGKAKYAGENPEDFPKTPKVDDELMVIRADYVDELKDLLKYVYVEDELRPAMTGIHFGYHEGKLNLVATDAHMLKVVNLEDFNGKGTDEPLFILSSKAAKILTDLNKKNKEPWIISIGMNTEGESNSITNIGFTLKTGNYGEQIEVITANIDEKFPEYWNVIPTEHKTALTVESKSFLKTLDKVAMFANKTTKAVSLEVGDKVVLGAEDIYFNRQYSATIFGEYTGEPIEIGFDADLLKRFINSQGDKVTFELTAPNRAVVGRYKNSLILLMPKMLPPKEVEETVAEEAK